MAKTLTQLLALVGSRYERNSTNLDADATARTAAINEASREMAMLLEDSCWYLQRVANVTWTVQPGYTMTLAAAIQSILYIEDPITPGQEIPHRGNGVSSSGELLVILDDVPSTTLSVHYLIAPVELVNGGDISEVPDLYADALVLGACKILAEGGGSAALFENFTRQFAARMSFVSRDCWRRHRQRQESQRVWLDTNSWNAGNAEQGPYW